VTHFDKRSYDLASSSIEEEKKSVVEEFIGKPFGVDIRRAAGPRPQHDVP
jgi:hypothetical protein